MPNGSRLSCGASGRGRKHPALRYELVGAQTPLPLKAGPVSFKRLLGGCFPIAGGNSHRVARLK